MPRAPRRTGVDECVHYLGEVGALMFFARAALDPGATGQVLLEWTLRLREALFTLHPDTAPLGGARAQQLRCNTPLPAPGHLPALHAHKKDQPLVIKVQQISTWRCANPIIRDLPQETSHALNLRVLTLEVIQATEGEPTWQGHLMLVLEPRTETFVHYFLKVSRPTDLTTDWILHVLAKADHAVRTRAAQRQLAQDTVLIALPDLQDTSLPYAATYREAAERIEAAIPQGRLKLTWLTLDVPPLTLHDAQLDVAPARRAVAKLTFKSAQSFSNTLIRASRAFNVNGQTGPKGPAWIALNPQKSENA